MLCMAGDSLFLSGGKSVHNFFNELVILVIGDDIQVFNPLPRMAQRWLTVCSNQCAKMCLCALCCK